MSVAREILNGFKKKSILDEKFDIKYLGYHPESKTIVLNVNETLFGYTPHENGNQTAEAVVSKFLKAIRWGYGKALTELRGCSDCKKLDCVPEGLVKK